jgi:hypothetical protein
MPNAFVKTEACAQASNLPHHDESALSWSLNTRCLHNSEASECCEFSKTQEVTYKHNHCDADAEIYSTVTDLAKFLGLSTSVPRAQAV